MSKHDLDTDDQMGFDNDFDFDYGSEDFDYEGGDGSATGEGKDRKPTLRTRFRRSLDESLDSLKSNDEFKRETLKKLLPTSYSSTIDMADTASYEFNNLWRQQEKHWETHRGEVKKLVKNYGDVLDSIGLGKIHDWAKTEERGSSSTPSEQELDEIKLQDMLGEFAQSNVDAQADRESQGKLTAETNEGIRSLNSEVSRQTAYNEKIDYAAKRKSLEFQARQLIVTQRTYELLRLGHDQSMAELKGIHQNTGLPDYVKTNTRELAQRTIKQQILTGATAPFNGSAKALFGRVKQRFSNKLGEFWNDIGGHISNINMGVDDESYTGGTASSRLLDLGLGLATDVGLKKPIDKTIGKLAPMVRRHLEEKHGISLAGNKLDTFMRQAGSTFNEALKSHDTGYKFFDWFKDKMDLAGAAFTANHTVRDESKLDLTEAGKITRKFTLTVEEYIPALLKRIVTNTHEAIHGTKPENLHWNYKNNEFEDLEEVKTRTLKKIYKKDRILNEKEKLENLINTIDPDQTLSPGLRLEIGKWLQTEKRNSNDCNPLKLLASNSPLSKKHLAEYALFAEHEFNLTDEDMVRLAGGTLKDMNTTLIKSKSPKLAQKRASIADAYADYQKTNGVDIQLVEKLIEDTSQLKALEKAGVIFKNDEGIYQYSYNLQDSITNEIAPYDRDDEKKLLPYRRNSRINFDEEGRATKSDLIDDDYDYKNATLKYKRTAKNQHPWLFESDHQKLRRDALERHGKLGEKEKENRIYAGNDYFINDKGEVVTNLDRGFTEANRKKHSKDPSLYTPQSKPPEPPLPPPPPQSTLDLLSGRIQRVIDAHGKKGKDTYASGGEIESFAKGGETKPKEPDEEQKVKVHGGEYVVDSEATKKNKNLLEAINKLGAPLFTANGEINRVYYKLLGFKTSREMDLKGHAGKLKQAVKDGYIEHNEEVIASLIANVEETEENKKDLEFVKDKKNQAKSRLVKAMKLFKASQVEAIKADPKGYAKSLARKGINALDGKIDSLIDPDKTGENVEIKNALIQAVKSQASGVGAVTRRGIAGSKEYVGSKILQHRARNIDRSKTLKNVTEIKSKNVEKGAGYLHKAADIYMVGRKQPVLRRIVLNESGYFDQKTGEPINNPDKVTGTILNTKGDVVLTVDEILNEKFYIKLQNGMTVDFRFVGLDSSNVIKKGYKEIATERLDIIKKSEKYQKAYATAKKLLVDEAIDIYLRGEDEPVLTAKGFKQGDYFDKETGNVLWTHHDIMGVVIDKDKKVLLSIDQLNDGLFDSKGNHVKINKIKQIRNIIAKRGNEIYKKHLDKHVKRYGGAVLDWMSEMGEHQLGMNFDSNPIDVYIKGEDRPAITDYMFKKGIVRDVKSEKIIKSHSGISGPVINVNDPFRSVITQEHIDNEMLVDVEGNPLYLPLLKTKVGRIKEYVKEALLPKKTFGMIRDFATLSPEKRKEKIIDQIKDAKVAYDVYVKGSPLKAILTKEEFEKGSYFSQKTGKVIHIPEMIDGPVVDAEGNVKLNVEQIKAGLVNYGGTPIKIGFNVDNLSLASLAGSVNIVSRIKKARAKVTPVKDDEKMTDIFVKGEKEPILKLSDIEAGKYYIRGTNKLVKSYSDILKGVTDANGNTIIGDKELKKGLVNIGGTSIATLGVVSGAVKSKFNRLRTNSWEMIREKMLGKKKEGEQKVDGKPKKDDEKHSWLGKLVPALGMMFGGVSATLLTLKSRLLSSFAWLGQVVATKSLGNGLGGFLGSRKKLAFKAATVGGYYGLTKMMDHYTADDEKFTDVNPNAYSNLDTTSRVMMAGSAAQQHMNDPKKEEPGAIKKFLTSDAGQTAIMALMMGGGLGKLGKLGLGGLNLAGRGLANAGLWGVKKGGQLLGRGAVSAATRAPGLLGKAGRVAGRVAKGSLKLTSLFSPKNLWSVTRAVAPRLLGLVSGPVLGLAALAVGGYYAYKFTKNFLNDKKNPWNRFRMAQYGFDHNDDGVVERINKIEQVTQAMIQFDSKGNPMIKSDEKAMNEILRICGFKDEQGQDLPDEKDRMSNFALWFKARFLRVYTSYLRFFKQLNNRAEMVDITQLKKQEQLDLLKAVHFTGLADSPYLVTASPFKDPDECEKKPRDVNVLFTKIGMAIKLLPDDVNTKVKKEANKDGIGGDVMPKPLKKDAPADKKVENEEVKLANKETKKLNTNANTKETVDAVKYQAKQMEAIAALHNESIRKETDKTIADSDQRIELQKSKEKTEQKKYGGSGGQGTMGAIGDSIRYALTNKVSQEMTTNETAKMAGGQKERQVQVYEAFIAAGFSENQSRALTAEVGRENSYSDKELFGSHVDPKSKVVNTGMISWNDTRRAKLLSFLGARGLVDGQGNIQKSQEGLNGQAEFIMDEMKNGAFKGKLDGFLYRPDIDYKTASYLLGTKYIKWAYKDEKYKSGHDNRDRFYNSLSEQISQGKTVEAKKAGLQTLSKSPVGGKVTRDEVQTVTFAKKGYYFGDSIAQGYKEANLGEGYTEVGADPKKVKNFILGNNVFKEPSTYRDQAVYLSTGLSNNPTQIQIVAEQLQQLRTLGVNVKVFGVSNTLPNADGKKLNIMLQSLCKTYKMEFLGGFKAGKDNIHPESYNSLGVVKTINSKEETQKQVAKQTAKPATVATATPLKPIDLKVKSLSDYAKSISVQPAQTQVDHANSSWDVDAIVDCALKKAYRDPAQSKGQCALYVRQALQAGDKNKTIKGGLGDAHDFLKSLPAIGWNKVGDKNTVTPQKGDVCVFPPYRDAKGKLHPVGHVCLFTGSQWVSDFYQKTMYPSSLKQDLPHSIFRANGVISKGVNANYVEPKSETKDVKSTTPNKNVVTPPVTKKVTVASTPDSVAEKMNDINSGNTIQSASQPRNNMKQQEPITFNTGSMEGILSKSLTVQEKMLEVMKDVLTSIKGGFGSSQNQQSSTNSNTQQQNGLTAPSLPSFGNLKQNEFKDVPAPFSVKKEG